MIAEIRKCDGKGCGNASSDYMNDGWIVVGEGGFKKYACRDKKGQALTEVYIGQGSDFCSWKCLKSLTGRNNP
jgi:hypothetical protein